MGAELWYHRAPRKSDPEDALLELQAEFLARTYDPPTLVRRHLASARDAVRGCEVDGDEYGLLDMDREQQRMLEDIAGRPTPGRPPGTD